MEQKIGKQIKLPFRRALQISLRGIRIRFGRSLVTVSGVVLGIAFLMSNLTGQLIKQAIAKERAQRDTVNMMLSLVRAEVGSVTGKKIAVAVCGTLGAADRLLLEQVAAAAPESLRGFGVEAAGVTPVPAERLGEGASLLLILGNGERSEVPLSTLAAGMSQRVALDSVEGRVYAGNEASNVRREPFFGKESDEQIQKARQQVRAERFRTIWIVAYSFAYRFGLVFGSMPYGTLFIAAAGAVVVGTLLAVLAAIYPARFASRMVPASALRSTV